MLVIPLRSQYVTLVITFLNAAAELCFADASMQINSALECRRLHRGKPLSARRHRRHAFLLTACSMALFFCVELVVGLFVDVDTQPIPFQKPCERLGVRAADNFHSFEKRYVAHSALFACSLVVDTHLLLFLANSSLVDAEIRCAERPSCEIFVGDAPVTRSVNGSTRYCLKLGSLGAVCTFTKLSGDVFSFSEIVSSDRMIDEIGFVDVRLFFEPGEQDVISKRVLQSLFDTSTDYDLLVSGIFFGSFSTSCEFYENREVVVMPVFVFILLVFMWSVSFAVFAFNALWRRSRPLLFDIGNTLDWAKVRLPSDNDHADKVVQDGFIHAKKVEGTRVLFATLS